MVNHNEILNDLFNRTISIEYNGKTFDSNYIEGDIFQVWEVLSHSKTKYPLIWLQSGYKIKENALPGNDRKYLPDCSFYLITKGDRTDFNSKRYTDTYKSILYPLLEKFKAKISKSGGINMDDNYDYITFPFNDIAELMSKESNGKSNPQKSTLSDIWDAIYLNVGLTINGNCYPQYKIKI